MVRIDLHTHSIASPDGGIRAVDYERAIRDGLLDYIAVTDHDTISMAQLLHEKLGDHIIIGEEVTTTEGDIIGLFLTEAIPPGMRLIDAVQAIRGQNGLVYVPHPFETVRHGLAEIPLDEIHRAVDIVEGFNGRAVFQNQSAKAKRWAAQHDKPIAVSSDAHGPRGWTRTYSEVAAVPTRDTLVGLLQDAIHSSRFVGTYGILYPRLHRMKKRFGHDQ